MMLSHKARSQICFCRVLVVLQRERQRLLLLLLPHEFTKRSRAEKRLNSQGRAGLQRNPTKRLEGPNTCAFSVAVVRLFSRVLSLSLSLSRKRKFDGIGIDGVSPTVPCSSSSWRSLFVRSGRPRRRRGAGTHSNNGTLARRARNIQSQQAHTRRRSAYATRARFIDECTRGRRRNPCYY